MRLMRVAILLAGIGTAVSAHGDQIVSGNISNKNLSGGVCSSSQSSSSALSLSCVSGSATDGEAQLNASVTPLSASMQISLSSLEDPNQPGMTTLADANLSFTIDGTYILTGGTGSGTVTWAADSYRFGEGGGGVFGPCSITIADVTQTCDLNAGGTLSGTFIVPYDTPVSLLFNTSYSAGAADFDSVYAGMNFNIDPMTPVEAKAPEPATWVFFVLASAMIYFLHRRRVKALR